MRQYMLEIAITWPSKLRSRKTLRFEAFLSVSLSAS